MLNILGSLMMLMFFFKDWSSIQLGLSLITFLMSLSCFHNFFMSEVGFMLGMDYLSFVMIYLSLWVMFLVFMSSQKIKNNNFFLESFSMVNLLLLMFLVLTFTTLEYMMFYISFEMTLIPTLILILGWGYQPERIQAGVYMLFYTLSFSLPLLGSLLLLNFNEGSLVMNMGGTMNYYKGFSSVLYMMSIWAFLVKLPMYGVHLWLPKAHVEAPVAGSMILAGVLLKLGGYGLVRMLVLMQMTAKSFSWLWVSISLWGGVCISLMCLRQIDLKALIAYSSVAHMSLVLCGIMIYNWSGLSGAVIVMIGHGLCSSGLFCLVNLVYERIGSRSLYIMKGLLSYMPSMGLWWFLLSVSNMASPPTLNLLGEISLIMSVVSWSKLSMMGIAGLSFFSASYSLYMYSMSQHGSYYNCIFASCSGKVNEFLVLFYHWLPLNVLILSSGIMIM
uniref:NADH dehydrogenase subunit 4 n=1 Tax=Domecia hispida TaxID=652862 RepID=UPI0028D0CFBF|nr:NADH dehydrogenase subunit 4 [Domecia hispida]WMQ53163.1 NADH dehydrogenase subunit 4 [Domecia hispida]